MDAAEPGVAVITGGSQGIGAGLVSAYRGQGWRVVANALTIGHSEDPGIVTVAGDISDPAVAERIIHEALERFGRVDTLVNNAGIFISKPFTEYTAEDYALVVGVSITGFFRLTQLAISEMVKQGAGLVINITTTIIDHAHSSEPSALVSLAKGGVAAATRSLAVEYASRNVRVNAVAPGVIKTPMHAQESYAAAARLAPMGRVGEISDIIKGVLFLQSSPFVTGETLHIDGGQIAGH